MTTKPYLDGVAKLREKYIQEFPEKLIVLEEGLTKQDRFTLSTLFHKLKGNGAIYGFQNISDLAKVMDQYHKKNVPDYFEKASLGIQVLKKIQATMRDEALLDIESIPEFIKLKGN